MCDACSPKPVLEALTPPRSTRARALPKANLRGGSTDVAGGKSAKPRTVVNVSGHRIYHVTHISNLAGIVQNGCLTADASESIAARPVVDISSAETREARRAAQVTGIVDGDDSVANYVPFFVTPDAALWLDMRSDAIDPRLAADTRNRSASEFLVLVSTVEKAEPTSTVIARGDAADPRTELATTPAARARELRNMIDDDDALADAELLVREQFPFESITLIGVANEKVRDEVRGILRAKGPKVAVYPPWFQQPTED
ncbi:DarT ssDNA thymidine ADP-ribosyltransferase family protein [Salinibacterium sp. ZJ450]|uniref:DarT ssDNA thymidine ADP-ribosyltransferase family protein n=1 Tax=Salinibacterium sp. ZJ450 TaxID=2708338 RepID=UPI00142325C1|nr:DarT ssDNA thymidine ADP-ribosyltransferase family protein [Salinibacterium sp. ZJ450]